MQTMEQRNNERQQNRQQNRQQQMREKYLNGEMTHSEYYLWLAEFIGITWKAIPISRKRIKTSTDPHLNDIPLAEWEAQHDRIARFAAARGLSWSRSDTVCILKTLARHIPEHDPADFSRSVFVGYWKGHGLLTVRIRYIDGKLSIASTATGQAILSFREYDHRGHSALEEISPRSWSPELTGPTAPPDGYPVGLDGATVKRLFDIWDRWHLNDMVAGSPRQEAYLRELGVVDPSPLSHYDWACKVLSEAGLHPDPETGYRYGSAWLREEVPADVLEFLKELGEESDK